MLAIELFWRIYHRVFLSVPFVKYCLSSSDIQVIAIVYKVMLT